MPNGLVVPLPLGVELFRKLRLHQLPGVRQIRDEHTPVLAVFDSLSGQTILIVARRSSFLPRVTSFLLLSPDAFVGVVDDRLA